MNSSEDSETKCRSCCASSSDLSSDGWQNRYDEGKTGWDRGEPSPMLMHWLSRGDLQPCRILVPGCGRGHEVIALALAGFEVTAVDFAPSAVEQLQAELERRSLVAKVFQSDLFAFCQSNDFDAIYEQTCLCAIDPSQWSTYEQLLSCWLRPGGRLFAMFMQSGKHDSPPFSCDLSAMRDLFHNDIWRWLCEPARVDHPIGMHEFACVLTLRETQS